MASTLSTSIFASLDNPTTLSPVWGYTCHLEKWRVILSQFDRWTSLKNNEKRKFALVSSENYTNSAPFVGRTATPHWNCLRTLLICCTIMIAVEINHCLIHINEVMFINSIYLHKRHRGLCKFHSSCFTPSIVYWKIRVGLRKTNEWRLMNLQPTSVEVFWIHC